LKVVRKVEHRVSGIVLKQGAICLPEELFPSLIIGRRKAIPERSYAEEPENDQEPIGTYLQALTEDLSAGFSDLSCK
jgi:hypothetical protein